MGEIKGLIKVALALEIHFSHLLNPRADKDPEF